MAKTPECFSKTDFTIDWQARTVTCPQGTTLPVPPRAQEDPESKVTVQFPKAIGQACPLKVQCTSGEGGLSISLDADDPARQAERERQPEETWHTHYPERSRVEHTVHRVTAHGGGTAVPGDSGKSTFNCAS